MLIERIKPNEPTFGYSSPLKTAWKKGLMPTVKYGIYGNKLTKKNISLEHIIPHSQGGKTELSNLLLADRIANSRRGVRPIQEVITTEQLINCLVQFIGVKNFYIDGQKYIEGILKRFGYDLEKFV